MSLTRIETLEICVEIISYATTFAHLSCVTDIDQAGEPGH